jgi:hypothetical protein
MGYQVGRICYETEQEAVNVLMAQVIPTIDKDGVLHHAVFDGRTWKYKEQTVQPTLPQCEFGEYAQAGREMGYQMILIMVALFLIVISMKAVGMIGKKDEE